MGFPKSIFKSAMFVLNAGKAKNENKVYKQVLSDFCDYVAFVISTFNLVLKKGET